ncbi:hypothetical protein [Oceanomicrobium pacificus]|uniref:Sulfotransferase family protein n=1 Tax=Oceanomicrobium pacificus TaxID=2692916 RepID=A0A6B0TVB1_9RHOB|nr:hypothetical protein [Oceanomicrobium pacificus]MXU65488.1 hypothetical protein [Oceanomicrobium pacificus]
MAILKLHGERHTGTRAMLAMIRRAGQVSLPGRGPLTGARTAEQAELDAAIESHFRGSWRRLHREAAREEAAAGRSALHAWKHAAPRHDPSFAALDMRLLLTVRDPYAWLWSLYRRPYHMAGPPARSLIDFIDRPWRLSSRDGLGHLLRSPVDLWQAKIRAAQACAAACKAVGQPVAWIRFEDFVADPAASLGGALRALDLPDGGLDPLPRSTKRDGRTQAQIAADVAAFDPVAVMGEAACARIAARLSPALCVEFGYRHSVTEAVLQRHAAE